jgi:hypothetical protein
VRTALGLAAYLAANGLAWLTLGGSEGSAWFLSTALIHVALAAFGRRWRVLLLPPLFMAGLAAVDKFLYRSNGKGDCHDWCGDLALAAGFTVFWLPLALLATASTLFILALVRVADPSDRRSRVAP